MAKGNFLYSKIGKQIVRVRHKRKLSQDDLAFISDMDRSYLAKVEEGKANPSVRTLHKIARKLKVHIAFLLKDV
jgi:transcriptional regulator with XRE-family HTH domain